MRRKKSDEIKEAFYKGITNSENASVINSNSQLRSLMERRFKEIEFTSLQNREVVNSFIADYKIQIDKFEFEINEIKEALSYIANCKNDVVIKDNGFKTTTYPSFSIIVNTYNRAETIRDTLESFKYIRYPGDFEVIVVNGPSNDGTKEILEEYKDIIKIGSLDEVNLSKSRNIGIALAKGDIIAFIDDDSVAESDWLFDLSKCYLDNKVACAGGRVYDANGYKFQTQYLSCNRLGEVTLSDKPSDTLCYPGCFSFPYCTGTNCSFRREVLISIGGFDEEIEYFQDETDVIARLIDKGYKVKQVDNAFVHHKSFKGHLRNANQQLTNYYPCIKNRLYFCLQQSNVISSYASAESVSRFIHSYRCNLVEQNEASDFKFPLFELDKQATNALNDCYKLYYFDTPKKLISDSLLHKYKDIPFLKFNSLIKPDANQIVFVCKDYESKKENYFKLKERIEELAKKGYMVHLICENIADFANKVHLINGVWIHSLITTSYPSVFVQSSEIKNKISDWSCTAYNECERIENHHHINYVNFYDLYESIAFVSNKKWKTVINFASNSSNLFDDNFIKTVTDDCLACNSELEKYIVLNMDFLKVDSIEAAASFERKHNIVFPKEKFDIGF